MTGYVYLLRAGKKHYKVGVTKNIIKRLASIQTSNPAKVELVTSKLVDASYETENELHKKLVELSSGGGSEWFEMNPTQVIELCIFINQYPHVEFNERVIVKDLLEKQLVWKKTVEKKMDIILNNYQKGVVRTLNYVEKPTVEEIELHKAAVLAEKQMSDKSLENEAIKILKQEGKASTSLLQRRLRIGYGRASRLIDSFEERGIISQADGSRAREVLV